MDVPATFDHEYDPARVVYGREQTSKLGDLISDAGADRALVVTGTSVGANEDVTGPVRSGLGDRLAHVFAGTTPRKDVDEAYEAVDLMDEHDADAIVAVGGGSSVDIGKAARYLYAARTDRDALRDVEARGESIDAPDDAELPPLVAIPTTLAGADLSISGSVSLPATGELPHTRIGIGDERAMPTACVYDPGLMETTPLSALAGSAMNGFNKGIELLYSSDATAMTDATGVHGLRLLRESLPVVGTGEGDVAEAYEKATAGIILVQYGRATPNTRFFSVLHSYGHGISRGYPVQQGVAHAVVAPYALEHVFERVDGRRELVAEGLGVEGDDPDELADGIVEAVAEVRDSLGLPSRFRDAEGVEREDLKDMARATYEDPILTNGPAGYDPSLEDIEGVMEEAW
jgi:alcohol dehydrogenase class IV